MTFIIRFYFPVAPEFIMFYTGYSLFFHIRVFANGMSRETPVFPDKHVKAKAQHGK